MDTAHRKVQRKQQIEWGTAQPVSQAEPRSAEATLVSITDPKHFRNLLVDALNDGLPHKDDTLFAPAQHHFATDGKLLRGILALASGINLGLPQHVALDWALAIEYLHNASLVHDDLCDDDVSRRNRPSVWVAFNRPTAICLGDWMIGKSFAHAAAAQSYMPHADLTGLLAQTLTRLSSGQASEFIPGQELDIDAYTQIVSGKTTPLFVAAMEGILHLAGEDNPSQIEACHQLFSHIGIAYQIGNDLDDHAETMNAPTEGDLMRDAPNAVYIAFRSGLSAQQCMAFDNWRSRADAALLGAWLTEISASNAVETAEALMQQHLSAINRCSAALTAEMEMLIMPILDHLAASHVSPTK